MKACELRAYHKEARRIGETIRSLRGRRPPHVNKLVWDNGVGWSVTAHYNVCYGPGHTSFEAMSHFGQVLDEKLQGEVDLDLFEWIWDQLGQTGPHGKQYTERFREQFRDDLRPDSSFQWFTD